MVLLARLLKDSNSLTALVLYLAQCNQNHQRGIIQSSSWFTCVVYKLRIGFTLQHYWLFYLQTPQSSSLISACTQIWFSTPSFYLLKVWSLSTLIAASVCCILLMWFSSLVNKYIWESNVFTLRLNHETIFAIGSFSASTMTPTRIAFDNMPNVTLELFKTHATATLLYKC